MYAEHGERRTSGSDKRIRTHVRGVRLSDEELHQLNRRAATAGLPVGTYLRVQALGSAGPRAQRRPVIEKEILARLLGHLGKVGSNLNQLAAAANSGDPVQRSSLEHGLADLAAMRRAVLEALGRQP